MPLIYVTGVSGSGKSTVMNELKRRGYKAYDVDTGGIAAFYHNESGKKVGHAEAWIRTPEWRKHHSWQMSREIVEGLAEQAKTELVFLCGASANDEDMHDLFDQIIALSLSAKTLEQRLLSRTGSEYGVREDERWSALEWHKTADQDYLDMGAVLVESDGSIAEEVDEIIKISTR